MGFEESIAGVAQRAAKLAEELETEEATKTALVMPFISALGYDVFNPKEVVPEFTADVGTKKGEKVDYAIKRGDEVIMLIECKKASADLSTANMSQLFRYFTVTSARIGVLTNGLEYRFFADLEAPNKMDSRPFLEFDVQQPRDSAIAELSKLSKDQFDIETMLTSANSLKSQREIKRVLQEQMDAPSEAFVRLFFGEVNPGLRFTSSAKEEFSVLTRRALRQFISDRVNDRLRAALEKVETSPGDTPSESQEDDDGIETTVDEIEGFHIVKAIVREIVEPRRIVHRDTKSYMGILLDDNNRKPICRLWFNRKQKYIGVFDENKRERRDAIEGLDDIYRYADELKATAARYGTEE